MVFQNLGKSRPQIEIELSWEGKIHCDPDWSILSRLHEKQIVLQKIVPEAKNYFEFLLQKGLKKRGS